MFYRISDRYVIRGYKQLMGVLIRRPDNNFKILTQEQFNILLLCDGVTDFSEYDAIFTQTQKQILESLVRTEIVEKLDTPKENSADSCYRLYENRFFSKFFWSVSGACNLNCRHCYMDAPSCLFGELPHSVAIRLIDEMVECGCLRVDLTGGEPFVRKDFFSLIDRFIENKIAIGQIYTNGFAFTEKTVEEFKKRNLSPEFVFSYDGIGWHDWMRRVKGSEERCENAIRLCRENGFPVAVEMCVHKGNISVLRETVNHLAKLGVHGVKISGVADTPLWLKNNEGMHLSFPEYLEAMLDYIPKFYEDGMPIDVMLCSVISMFKGSPEYQIIPAVCGSSNSCDRYLCGAIRNSCYIAPDGRVVPCMAMLSSENANLFLKFQDVGLKNILSGKMGNYMSYIDKRIKDLIAENAECRNCEFVNSCGGGCRAMAFTETGDLMGKDEKTCFIWKNGYSQRISEIAKNSVSKYCKE